MFKAFLSLKIRLTKTIVYASINLKISYWIHSVHLA